MSGKLIFKTPLANAKDLIFEDIKTFTDRLWSHDLEADFEMEVRSAEFPSMKIVLSKEGFDRFLDVNSYSGDEREFQEVFTHSAVAHYTSLLSKEGGGPVKLEIEFANGESFKM